MQLLRRLSITMLLLILAGCGGGDGSLSDGNTPVTPTNPMTLDISLSSDTVSDQAPVTVTATVVQGSTPVVGKLVSFSIIDPDDTNEGTVARFDPENGAVSTDADGIAQITLLAGEKAGGAEVVATIDSGATSSESVGFNSAGDGASGETPKVASISLFASTQQLASSGAQEIELTAIVKDSSNNLVEGAPINFSSDSGQIEVQKSTTEKDGQAIALLRTANEPTNRVITVTATSDSRTDIVDVQVIGTAIQLTGSSSLALNDENTFIVKVLDSDGNGIVSTPVSLSLGAQSGANITIPSTVITDFTGQATFTAIGTSGGTNTIIASSLGAVVSQPVTVQEDSFLFSSFSNTKTVVNPSTTSSTLPDVGLSDSATVTLTWLRAGVPVPDGTTVGFTSTRGTLSSFSSTTVNGAVSVALTSNNAGKALVTFTGTDGNTELSNQLEFEFVAEVAETVVAQASPASIGPSEQTSVITVVIKDINGNLVKNKVVDFTLTDTNGGSIFPASDITDSNGTVSTVYTSNAVSAKDGVSIKASVREDSSKSDTVNLTVADRELFISLGTGNTIEEFDITNYNKQYSVFVTDVDSTPIENVELKVSAIPKFYGKGFWVQTFDDAGEFKSWVASRRGLWDHDGDGIADELFGTTCPNEDVNQDGILDAGEDTNGDGILTPGNIVAATGDLTTDENGRAIIDILYPQSYGGWSEVELIISAKVTGTESFEQTVFTLPINSDDTNSEEILPPTQSIGLQGPFGYSTSCNNAI